MQSSAPSLPRVSSTSLSAATGAAALSSPRHGVSTRSAGNSPRVSPGVSPTSSPRQEGDSSPAPARQLNSPRLGKLGSFFKGLVGKDEQGEGAAAAAAAAAEEGAESGAAKIGIVKTRSKSAFGTPLSTVSKRRSPRGKQQSVQQPAAHSPLSSSSSDVYIIKKDEPSAFPGFQVSTMANRGARQRRAVGEVFDESHGAPQAEEDDEGSTTTTATTMTTTTTMSHSTARESVPDLPALSEDETLRMLAPVAADRMRVARRTHRLDLSGFLLGFVPSALAELPGLATLNLAGNNVRNFGEGSVLSGLTALQELDLSFNELAVLAAQDVSLDIINLQLPVSVTNLSLRDNDLPDVPTAWLLEQLPQLSGLDLRFNKVASLDGLGRCRALEELLAGHNCLELVTGAAFAGSRESLKSVDLSHNQIRVVEPEAIAELPRVEALVLAHNRLTSFAFEAALHSLVSLDLSYNSLTSLGSEFGLLTRLHTLRARCNQIAAVNFSFQALEELRLLDLSHNRLRSLPEDLALARQLRTVMLSCNKLVDLSAVPWEELPALSVLVCAGNLIEQVPEALCAHPAMEVLHLGYNRLAHVESVQGCFRLKILHLGGNAGMTVGPELVHVAQNARLLQVALGDAAVGEEQLACMEDFGASLQVDLASVGVATAFGGRTGLAEAVGLRSAMEDRSVAAAVRGGPGGEQRRVWAVLDGHGGEAGSAWAAAELAGLLERQLAGAGSFQDVLGRVFAALDEGVARATTGGATAVVAVESGGRLHVANAGDARAVLVRRGRAQRLSVDHRTTLPAERDRIRRGGGVVLNGRLGGVIEVTRALGDAALPLCLCEPHVAATAVEEGDVLVLGCDGIFDELSDEMVAGVLARVGDNPRLAAQMLRDEAFFLGSADNLSCIVASLK